MTVHHSVQFIRLCLRRALASAFGCLALLLCLPSVAAQQGVGQFAISVGEVEHVRQGRAVRPALGSSLREGDRIRTGKDGMAILIFSDQARVSLRADSELIIDRYRLPEAGQPAEMRLELVRGAMRQISGDAMRSDPSRYRLNTPVAAIGVRGTDFLAKASEKELEAFIQEGSIVLMPLGNGCSITQDSPSCAPIDQLAATDVMRYLKLTASGERERKGVSPSELEQLFGIKLARASAPLQTSLADPEKSVALAAAPISASQDAAATEILRTSQQQVELTIPVQGGDLTSVSTPTGANAAESPVPLAMPTQLVWGRYATAAAIPVTPALALPVTAEQASKGRHVTVGEPFEYALWRDGTRGSIDKGLRGLVSYSFVAGEAYFQAAGASTASQATINSAKLLIDFDRARFEAAFGVSHTATGLVGIAASGAMNDEGVFSGGNDLERVAGAVSKDGSEAGALFSKSIQAGTVRGITLFRRP